MISKKDAFAISYNTERMTEEFCNYTLSEKIRESAIEGFINITVGVPDKVDMEYAVDIIKNQGFDVYGAKGILYIRWGEGYKK